MFSHSKTIMGDNPKKSPADSSEENRPKSIPRLDTARRYNMYANVETRIPIATKVVDAVKKSPVANTPKKSCFYLEHKSPYTKAVASQKKARNIEDIGLDKKPTHHTNDDPDVIELAEMIPRVQEELIKKFGERPKLVRSKTQLVYTLRDSGFKGVLFDYINRLPHIISKVETKEEPGQDLN